MKVGNSMDKMEIDKKAIGNRLSICRKAKNLTQEVLSEKIGLETKSYSNIETGYRLFSVDVLLKLIKELDVSADYILFGTHHDKTPVTEALNALDGENLVRAETILRLFSEAVAEKE